MEKIALTVTTRGRVRAQFLAAGIAIAAGVLNIISKSKINKATSEFKGEELVTANIGSSKNFTLLVADIVGAYDAYKAKLPKPAEALPLWVDGFGKTLKTDKLEGFINPNLQFVVENGTFLVDC